MSYQLADGSLSTDYKVGDLFISNDPDEGMFKRGSLIKLAADDKSSCPRFELITGEITYSADHDCTYEDWGCLISCKQQPELYTESELNEIDELRDEIDKLNDLCSGYAEIISEKDEYIERLLTKLHSI